MQEAVNNTKIKSLKGKELRCVSDILPYLVQEGVVKILYLKIQHFFCLTFLTVTFVILFAVHLHSFKSLRCVTNLYYGSIDGG